MGLATPTPDDFYDYIDREDNSPIENQYRLYHLMKGQQKAFVMNKLEGITDPIVKELLKPSPKITLKIAKETSQRENLYLEKSILNDLEKELGDVIDQKFAEKLLGRILDKTELAKKFINYIPLYYDNVGIWWRWDHIDFCWRMVDETDILIMVNKTAETNVINSKEKTEILNALKLEARANKPEEVDNLMIQFNKEIVNLKTGDRYPASPKYFVTNPIPFKLGRYPETQKFDKLFSEWVVNEEDKKCLYEIMAYCLLPEYPIERIFALLGSGANGKSTYLKILYTFLGMRNVCTTNLDTLTRSRFETTRLYKKLACIMAETNLAALENSQIIKRLVSGKDPIPIEFKNKGLTEIINYAKMIIATNNLPPTDDKTDGFYRRWRIIEFPNQFQEEKDVLADITREDYEALAMKCLLLLDDLLKKRSFAGDGTIAERKLKYEEKSNPFDKFWNEFIEESDADADIACWEFEKEINEYMKNHQVRSLSSKCIAKLMREKGVNQIVRKKEWYENNEAKTKTFRVWGGIKWKE